jgi:hypothetical protein
MSCNNVNIENFQLGVSSGDLSPSYKQVFKFGQNASVGNSIETIWLEGGLYVYPPSATTMTVSSSDVNDTSAGTGARTVLISGLDGSYNEISETITMNGQTPVTTSNSYLRVNRALVLTAGSGGVNAGIIYVGTGTVTSGVPANKYTTKWRWYESNTSSILDSTCWLYCLYLSDKYFNRNIICHSCCIKNSISRETFWWSI